jgi:hypothetical protein
MGTEITDLPTIKREVDMDDETKHQLLHQEEEEAQVIIHCLYTGTMHDNNIRIWKSTFLDAKNSDHRSTLVHVENISMHPNWMHVKRGQTVNFTLIFTGLPKDCNQFDMIESIPESGGFVIQNIARNHSDVYTLKIT